MNKDHKVIEKYVFKKGITKKYINTMMQQLRDTIQQQQWCLGDRNFKDYLAKDLFESTVIINAKILWLDLNKRSVIITDIIAPMYPSLQILYLGDNNIANIEQLILLNAQKLQKLYLNNNQITNIKSMRKCQFLELDQLNLNGNYFIQQHYLQFCNFPLLTKLSLGYQNKKQNLDNNMWSLKTQFSPQIKIYSSKSKIYPYSKISYFNKLVQQRAKYIKPVNLFKTFQK